ncbi:hypothetical protein P2H44_11355 [Albimonas sp. CAU 1670]|uniref:type IV secretory system conjugative DNA transfer family protein n=1 Tax=Albimonas sp. CAU 1670 TaxID=3032599 RepID=UPI0023DA03B2|nr:hypothetical protein [Albimonas sp. CAU 1670]MDF2233148.1 hypothetical protein [Albimonas sp. CAU 1670]
MAPDDRHRFQHRWILGQTGMGKSTLMLNLMLADIDRGDGLFYVDPHGEDADQLLELIPPRRVPDVILFDPSDLEHPAPINMLERVAEDWRPFVASSIVDAFKSVWGYERLATPVMDQYLYNASAALLDAPDGSLMGIRFMLTNDRFRERVLAHLRDPIVRDFWETEYAGMSERERRESARSTLNKIGMLLADPRVRNVIGPARSAIDLDAVMRGRILIARLPQGRLGLQKTATLGALLLARLHAAALAREDDRPFHVYLDECHHFGGGTLVEMISGIRKFRVSLTLCHQYLDQLRPGLREAVTGGVGTRIAFRTGHADAEALRHVFPVDGLHDSIAKLPPYAARIVTPSESRVMWRTPTVPEERRPEVAKRIRAFSRRHYTRSRRKVRVEIRRLAGLGLRCSRPRTVV